MMAERLEDFASNVERTEVSDGQVAYDFELHSMSPLQRPWSPSASTPQIARPADSNSSVVVLDGADGDESVREFCFRLPDPTSEGFAKAQANALLRYTVRRAAAPAGTIAFVGTDMVNLTAHVMAEDVSISPTAFIAFLERFLPAFERRFSVEIQ